MKANCGRLVDQLADRLRSFVSNLLRANGVAVAITGSSNTAPHSPIARLLVISTLPRP